MHPLPRPRPSWLIVVLLVLITAATGRATTIIAPSFSDLVAKSDSVILGEVTAITSELVTRGTERAIFTRVTLAVRDTVIGSAPTALTLEFLGGTVGELTMDVDGIPLFAVGRTEILFVQNNGRQICPLVGMAHGRYKIERDPTTGVELVTRDNGATLTNVAQVSLPLTRGTLPDTLTRLGGTTPLSPVSFMAEIRAEHARQLAASTR